MVEEHGIVMITLEGVGSWKIRSGYPNSTLAPKPLLHFPARELR